MKLRARVPANATENYWNGWWKRVDNEAPDADGMFVIESLRNGVDAEYDAEVLQGRLASGLHRCEILPPS